MLIDISIKKNLFWQINLCNLNYLWNVEWNVYIVYYVNDRYVDNRYKIVFNEWVYLHFDDDVNLKKKFEFDCIKLNRRNI